MSPPRPDEPWSGWVSACPERFTTPAVPFLSPHFSTGFTRRLLTAVQEIGAWRLTRRKLVNRYCGLRLLARSVASERLGNVSGPACSTHVESRSRPLDPGFLREFPPARTPSTRGWVSHPSGSRGPAPLGAGPRCTWRACADSDNPAGRACHSVTSDPRQDRRPAIPAVQRLVLADSTDITCASWCMCDEPSLHSPEPERRQMTSFTTISREGRWESK